MIPQPTSCGTLARPFMAGPFPLGSRSRREPETSSTAKTPRRKQNRNTASSKSLFLSASKINTSQPGQSIGPLLRSAPRGPGGHDLSTRPVGPPPVFQVFPSTAAKPHLVQQFATASLLMVRAPPPNQQTRSPHHQPPGSETTWDSCWRAETKKGREEPTGRDASVQAHHIIGRDEVHWSAHAPETPSTCLCHMGPMIRPFALPCRSAQPRSSTRSATRMST